MDSPFANSIAVVVGIDVYGQGIPALRTAANDARRVASILAESHGYEVIQLIDAEASQARITALLKQELPARVGPDDRVFFYWAGHGVALDGDDGPNGYLLPSDARRGDETSYLHMPLVHDALLDLQCRHMLVVLDSCFSGAFRWSGTRDIGREPEVIHQEKYDRFVRDAAWQVITSASQDETAMDQLSAGALGSRDGEGAHSPFALALFAALEGKGDLIPSGQGDGLVIATELYLYIGEQLQSAAIEVGRNQTARLWPLRKHDKGEFVFFVPGKELNLPPAPPLTTENNPWRGLASYEAADASLFFGRDAEIARLRTAVELLPLTVVLGASGTGKSSLVKAGLVPAAAAAGWLVLPIVRPGTAPLAALAQAVTASGSPVAAETAAAITAALRALIADIPGRKVLLVVDQLEELITLVRAPAERAAMLSLLARLTEEHADALRVVLTLRSDFEPNFDRAAFGDGWRAGRFVVQPMSREDLRAVIEQPAAKRVVYFEPSGLIETLLDEVVATPGALPLLSFALSEMYLHYLGRRSEDRAITRDDYDALGGVVGALRARAEAEHDALDTVHRATLRRLMLRMVVAEGGTVARRRVADAEIDYPDDAENARVGAVMHRLTSARLLVEGKEPDGDAFVEPAHDALVRGWGRLLEWVREESEAPFPLAQRQRLTRAAADWDRADRGAQSGLLWSDGVRSAQLAPLVRRRDPSLNRRELEFARRSVRGRRVLLGAMAATALVVAAAGAWAFVSGRRATERAEQMRIGAVVRTAASIAPDDPMTARLLLASLDSTMLARADAGTHLALLATANGLVMRPSVTAAFGELGSGLGPFSLSPDGSHVVAVSGDDAVRVWQPDGTRDTATAVDSLASEPIEGTEATVNDDLRLVFDRAGKRFATVASTGTVRVWETGRGGPLATIPAPPGRRVVRLSFGADGQRLVVFRGHTKDGQDVPPENDTLETELWSVDGRRMPTRIVLGRGARPVADDGGDGSLVLAVTPEGALHAWPLDARGGSAPRTIRAPARITGAIISPDVDRVAVMTDDQRVRIMPLNGSGRTVQLTGHSAVVRAAAWSPQGSRLVTVADDGARVWDAITGRALAKLQREGETMAAAEFDVTGDAVVTRSTFGYDAIVWRWPDNPTGPASGFATVLTGHADRLTDARFLDDGRVFTASVDGTARVWEPNAWIRSLSIDMFDANATVDERARIASAAFSRDGRLVAVGTADGMVGIAWLDHSQPAKVLARDLETQQALAFTADGRRLTGLSVSGRTRIWDLDRPDSGRVVHDERLFVAHVDLFAGGRWAVSRGEEGVDSADIDERNDVADYLWDLASDAAPRRLEADGEPTGCTSVSEDGRWLATCTQKGNVRLQRLDGPPDAPPVLELPVPGLANATALTRDGSLLAVGTYGGLLQLIETKTRPVTRELPGAQTTIDAIEFSPDGRRLLTYARDGMLRIWDVASGRITLSVRPRGLHVESAHFTPDGQRVLTLPAVDTVAYLYNADGSGGVAGFSGVGRLIGHAFIDPDGRWLLTTLDDGSAGLWPLDATQILRDMDGSGACLSAADRVRYLNEVERDANGRHAACVAATLPRSSKSP